jgi:cysteine desulfurase
LKKIYLDSSATTPVFPEAVQAMVSCMQNDFGNPSSSHSFGRNAKKLLNKARRQVSALINAEAEEIYFTSGGTEADNLAVLGVADRYEKGHIITTAVEHHATLASCEYLESKGFRVTYLPVNEEGMIRIGDLQKAVSEDTILISVMHGNNEVGTVQPVEEIGRIARYYGIPFHVDAVQSLGKIEVDVQKIGCDFLTCSSHKINGPKGVGALYIKKDAAVNRILFGGGQEKNIRSGTENMPGIVGFGMAAEITGKCWRYNADYTEKLRDYFFVRLESELSDVKINGSRFCRLPHNINFSLKGIDGFSLMLLLDSVGIAVSTGSACHSDSEQISHVLLAMGLSDEWVHGTVRMTLGSYNTREQLDFVIEKIKEKRQLLLEAEALYVT